MGQEVIIQRIFLQILVQFKPGGIAMNFIIGILPTIY